jgi:FtsP/CotA-like multicopper oxidase with cupredoxin domain
MNRMNRRTFIRKSALALLLTSSGCSSLPFLRAKPTDLPSASQLTLPSLPTSDGIPTNTGVGSGFIPDVEIDLQASQQQVQVLPGQPTTVWAYQGTVVQGDAAGLLPLQGSYLGPLIRVRKGQKVRVRFTHDLPEPSIVHWHGLLLPARMDGHPRDAIPAGQTYVYEFEVINRAGTYWFHPHPEPLTGGQVIRGLAGLFLVSDDEEAAAGLPSGAQDIPLVIQDRTFDQNNQIVYVQGSIPGMQSMPGMDQMMGFLGERILVNGQVNALLPIATRAYRLRLVNGSNSRVYKLAWSHGAPLTVIATDGGLLERPVERPYVMLGPGERIELWADFRQYPVGTEVTLQSLPFLGAEGDSLLGGETGLSDLGVGVGMEHGGMMGVGETPTPAGASQAGGGMEAYHPKLPNGSALPILQIRVERQEQETLSIPTKLSTINRYPVDQVINRQQPRRFGLSMHNMTWLINGRSFNLEEVAPDEIVKLNTLEAWDFVNEQNPNESMEKMGMVHPMHIHGVQFQVIDRQVLVPALKAGWDSVHEGYVDEGWKDTVLVMPGEGVRLLLRFDFPDLFLYHCHNLEHEDLGMMRNYRVDF